MRRFLLLASLLAAACSSPTPAAGTLAVDRPETKTDQMLVVTSPAFGHGGTIPLRYTAYGANEVAPLAWSALPSGARLGSCWVS